MTTTTAASGQPGLKLAYLSSLGDAAVDFDIAPPRVVTTDGGGGGSDGGSDTTLFSSTAMMRDVSISSTGSNARHANDSLLKQKRKSDSGKIEWPIVILQGDGNVYILCAGIDTDRPKLQGPISILPQVDDNYGLDSCALEVIPSLPPTHHRREHRQDPPRAPAGGGGSGGAIADRAGFQPGDLPFGVVPAGVGDGRTAASPLLTKNKVTCRKFLLLH